MPKVYAVELEWHDVVFVEASSAAEAEQIAYEDRDHTFATSDLDVEVYAEEVEEV